MVIRSAPFEFVTLSEAKGLLFPNFVIPSEAKDLEPAVSSTPTLVIPSTARDLQFVILGGIHSAEVLGYIRVPLRRARWEEGRARWSLGETEDAQPGR